jgi:hypothetical protein
MMTYLVPSVVDFLDQLGMASSRVSRYEEGGPDVMLV